MKKLLLIVSACVLVTAPTSGSASADTISDIKALKARLLQLEAQVAKQRKEAQEAEKAKTNVANIATGKDPNVPPPVFVDLRKGLFLETEDHEYAFKVGGRILIDGGGISQPLNGFSGNAGFRQVRLETEGKMRSWFYKIQYDFATPTVGQFNANVETAAQQFIYNANGQAVAVNPYYRYYTDRNFIYAGMRDVFVGLQDKRLSADWLEQPVHFRIGNMWEPFGLETITSSKYRDTIERPMVSDALAPSRHIGAEVGFIGKNGWGANMGIFTISPEDMINQPPSSQGQFAQVGVLKYPNITTTTNGGSNWYQSYGGGAYMDLTGRVTYAPIRDEHNLVHLGISGLYHQPNSSTGWNDDRNMIVGNRVRSEANILNQSLIGTTDLSCGSVTQVQGLPNSFNTSASGGNCVKNIEKIGLEAAASYHNLFVQAEYMGAHYNRNSWAVAQAALAEQNSLGGGGAPNGLFLNPGNNSLYFSGYYVAGEWWITGEEKAQAYDRSDKSGVTFAQLKIKDKFSDGGWGAWGLVGRLSALNLNNGPYQGGALYNMLSLATFCPNGNCASNPFTANGSTLAARGVANSGVYGGYQQNATVGVNWYPDNGIAFQTNITRVMSVAAPLNWNQLQSYSSGAHPTLIEFRTKLYF